MTLEPPRTPCFFGGAPTLRPAADGVAAVAVDVVWSGWQSADHGRPAAGAASSSVAADYLP